MKIVVHDYSGHPGQVHLSRELARRGYVVDHQFCTSYTTGRGALELRADDVASFTIHPVSLKNPFARYSPFVRVVQELQYAWVASRAITSQRPDIAVLSNIPLLALFLLSNVLKVRRIRYVFWQQDVYSDAITTICRQRLGRIGALIGWVARRCERRIARGASAVVAISDTFVDQLRAWGVRESAINVIPNWAAIDEMPLRSRENAWATANGTIGVPVVMYAGTLGWKHDPGAIADLARTAEADTRVVVVSEGLGREWLATEASDLPGLNLVDYQPYEQLPEMLASADVLLVLLEQDASRYSVPSKVLNYLCAGRPVLAILPRGNAVAQIIESTGAGLVVTPGDRVAASAALSRLLADPGERARMGAAARAYAERTFDVGAVGARFEAIFDRHDACAHDRR